MRSRLDAARVVRASDTLAQSAKPAARKLSQAPLDSLSENSGTAREARRCRQPVTQAQPLDPTMRAGVACSSESVMRQVGKLLPRFQVTGDH